MPRSRSQRSRSRKTSPKRRGSRSRSAKKWRDTYCKNLRSSSHSKSPRALARAKKFCADPKWKSVKHYM